MQEMNLIDGEIISEPIVNNAPVVVNEVDINSLSIPSEDDLSKELGNDCRMNKLITFEVKETSYKCLNCPNHMKHICLYCIETCHKSHIKNLPSYLFKGDLVDFQKYPCECAKNHHKTTEVDAKPLNNEERTNCPFDQLFGLIKPKYAYRRKDNNKSYCLFCINNYSIITEPQSVEDSSIFKDSKKTPFGSLVRKSISIVLNEEKKKTANAEIEDVLDDKNFYDKYEKFEVDYSQPFPQCECNDDLHKHQITSENIENLVNYMTNIVNKNKLNLDKLSFQIFNSDVFIEAFFQKLVDTHENIYNLIKDIDEIKPSLGSLPVESDFTQIDLDEKADWEIYHKSTKLFETAAKRLKIFNFFGINWMNERYKKYFSFETLNKLLQCKSNIESNFFKLQLF